MSNRVIFSMLVIFFVGTLVSANNSTKNNLKVNFCPKMKNPSANITYFEVSGCTAYPCIFKRNSTSAIKLGLNFLKKVTDLKVKIAGQINGRDFPFSVNDKNLCLQSIKTMNKSCDLKKGSDYIYEHSLPILKEYPKIQVIVKYELLDQKKHTVTCLSFPVKIE